MTEKKRAFSYIRMSTDAQLKGHSLKRQLQYARDYASANNMELVEDLRDIGISAHSGDNVKKGKLGAFLKAIEDGEIEQDCVLLVESLDRLSRQSARKSFNQLNQILDYGIEVHTLADKQVYTAQSVDENSGQLFTSLGIMLRANSESEEKSQRGKKNWQYKRDNIDNKILTSRCPAWLKPNDDRTGFEPIAQRVEAVRLIFRLCIEHEMGAYAIAKHLNANLVSYPPFKSKKGWHKSSVSKILNNRAVIGEFCPHTLERGKRIPTGEIIEDYYPAIIDEQVFLLAQSKRQKRAIGGGGRKGDKFHNVFTKLVQCGKCGGSVNFSNKGDGPKGGKYLRCHNSVFNKGCSAQAWRYDEFFNDFIFFVSETSLDDIFKKKNFQSAKARLHDKAESLEQKYHRLNDRFEKTLLVIADASEIVRKRANVRLEELASELESIEERKAEIGRELVRLEEQNAERNHFELIDTIKKLQTKLSEEEKVEFRRKLHAQIRKFVERIVIYNTFPVFDAASGIENNLSPNVLGYLKEQGHTEDEILELFEGATGNLQFSKAERHFVVEFKNGFKKSVHPFIEQAIKFDNNKFIKFKAGIDSKQLKKKLEQKKATIRYKRRSSKQAK